jgi:hypothetical protein
MSTTVQNLIDYAQTFTQYSPLAVGTGFQPALGIANELQNTVLNPPFTWAWNRKEDTSLTTVAGQQDYTVNLTDFGFLERITLVAPDGTTFEVRDIYNNLSRGIANTASERRVRPQSAAVLIITPGVSIKLRFMGNPDQAYACTLTYQKIVVPLTALTGGSGTLQVPDQMIDVFNMLFTAEALAAVDDARSTYYRQRGVMALLSKAEGLSDMQINAFLEQWGMQNAQGMYRSGTVQQSVQAKGA